MSPLRLLALLRVSEVTVVASYTGIAGIILVAVIGGVAAAQLSAIGVLIALVLCLVLDQFGEH